MTARFAEAHGWTLFRSPSFEKPYLDLMSEVAQLRVTHPQTWQTHPKAKLLKRIDMLIYDEIPQDPNATQFYQGNTLGPANRHWRRAKFLQRFRLFFRFDSQSRIIIYAWVNDEKTLRQAGAKTDPYVVFEKRLMQGDPPSDWEALLDQSKSLESLP